MKRVLSVLLLMLLAMSGACAEGENTLLRHAVEMGEALDKLAEDGEYIARYSLHEQALAAIGQLSQGDRTAPNEVRMLDMDAIMSELEPELAALPEVAVRNMQKRMPAATMNSLISAAGEDQLIASTIIRYGKTFAAPEVSGQGLWILYYEAALPVAVAWYAENGAVQMDAAILPDGEAILSELPVPTRVVAAARPALDAAAAQLADELRELAQSDAYLNFVSVAENVKALIHDFTPAEEQPRLALCTLADAEDNQMLLQLVGEMGVLPLAAMSAMQHSMIFADPDASGSGLYLFLYEDGAPIIVRWSGENGAYHLSASFQPGEYPASCRNAEDVNAWAASIGLNIRFQEPGAMLLP